MERKQQIELILKIQDKAKSEIRSGDFEMASSFCCKQKKTSSLPFITISFRLLIISH